MIVCLGQWGTIMESFSMGCTSVETCELIDFADVRVVEATVSGA